MTRIPSAAFLSLLVVAAVAAGGCAGALGSDARFVTPTPPPPMTDYVVQPGDTLGVKFYYHPDHDQDTIVRPDGKILLPLVGEVPAAGLTPDRLGQELALRYATNLRDPKIAVTVKAMNQSRIYVGGEVGTPGFLTYRPGLTALQAMLEAGGPKDTARVEEVVLLQRVGNDRYRASKVNLAKIIEEGDTAADIALGPSDVMFVPKTPIAKLNLFVEQYILKVLPIRPTLGGVLF